MTERLTTNSEALDRHRISSPLVVWAGDQRPLVQPLADAVRLPVGFVAERGDDATADDDVKVLEQVAHLLDQTGATEKARLRELLGPTLADNLGIGD